ncbi:MAG: RNA polymerase factor sigma-54 [Anaerovoracaceae bacterium]|jgi:RNA polymerase sigma-54 factor
MKLGYELTIEQTQKLVMTPELIQAIQILQFNTQELETYVSEQLLTNPVLEQDPAHESNDTEAISPEDSTREEALNDYLQERDYDDISYRQRDFTRSEQQNTYEQYVTTDETLPEHLLFQLQYTCHDASLRRLGRYIIESLDQSGYMTATLEEIAAENNVSTARAEEALQLIQSFDPVGVGARSLSECLLLQLQSRGERTDLMERVLNEYLEDLAANRLNVIARALRIPTREVQRMADLIRTLEPRPGNQFAGGINETRYIVPDVIVEKIDGEYIAYMNERNVPGLMVSSYYRKVLAQSGKDTNVSKYLSERLNSAVWLIRSIEQRKRTILNVVEFILQYQRDFFDRGDKYLKTLTLRQAAEELGVHESTVSRSINGKYMQCPRGVYELRHFFSAGVQRSDGGDGGISSTSIKTHIRELIDQEDPKAPYSDQKLVTLLAQRGIVLSRRTVAKYRDEMNILSSSKRKRY